MIFYLCTSPRYCMTPFRGADEYWWKNSIYIRDYDSYCSLLQKNRIRTPSGGLFLGGWCSLDRLTLLKIKKTL